ncbi:Putative ribonuclease H protein [Dendrobium catenatum]|uniref:Ribonuclease H protein n=1 Tax=Dendrobium catenatum TaxID=906689 RepID=A0A2I0W810_9ASPA|nr:Putative ribonuclease H protein [Dendrobium catenatum]
MSQKLDHIIFNNSWISTFQLTHIKNLTRTLSNLSPLLLSITRNSVYNFHPFRFQNIWLLDDSFLNSVQSNWKEASSKFPVEGDRNTTIFYNIANHNKMSRQIHKINFPDGDIIEKPNLIFISGIEYFEIAFNKDFSLNLNINPLEKIVPVNLLESLLSPITDSEIKKVIFDGAPNSSPGPDGYTFEFYKSSWEITGLYVCQAIKNFLSSGRLPDYVKATAIVLIPKQPHATHIADFRPISLCNTFYKIIAKLLANRMRDIMPIIIHPSQAGFIKGRLSSDNVILASEILREMGLFSKINHFCAKLDIKKAFDTVSREFISHRMRLKGFPPQFIKWVNGCIYDVPFYICLNGKLEGYFISTSGLRQGCPLSPLLFDIAMDALSCTLDAGDFRGITFGNNSLSHLLYADDVLVFGATNLPNALNLNLILDDFAASSGLKINNSKCTIIFSKETHLNSDIANLLGYQISVLALKYLGLPIALKKLSFSNFLPQLSRLSTLLDGWKVKFLSFAGRIQFLKFTIANTIAYWIRGAILPKRCCKLIERYCARFLYHGNASSKKLHLISWKRTCKPTVFGGLGIPDIQSMQFGFACTFLWRYYNANSLAAAWLRYKYHSPYRECTSYASKFWKSIFIVASKIKNKLNFQICNSNSILSFYWDPWLSGNSIANITHGAAMSYASVSDYLCDGNWCLPLNLNPNVNTLIHSLQTHDDTVNISWMGKDKPIFRTFKLLYFEGEIVVN